MVQAVAEKSTYSDYTSVNTPVVEAASITTTERPFKLSDVVMPIAGMLAGSLIVGAALVYFWDHIQGVGNWAYLSIFLAELGNSAAIFIPTPGPAYTIAMSLVLNPFAVGIIGGIAATLGELVGYYVGRKSGRAIEGKSFYARLESLSSRWGGKALFAFAALPIPFDFAGIWAGTVRYPIPRFMLYVGAGKIIKITGLAMVGAYGLTWFLGPLA